MITKSNKNREFVEFNFKFAFKSIADIVFPAYCLSCNTKLDIYEKFLCTSCSELIVPISGKTCSKCSKQLPEYSGKTKVCEDCRQIKWHFKKCEAITYYDKIIKKILHEVKFKKRPKYLNIFDKLLSNSVKNLLINVKPDIVVPVPSDKKTLRERTFNQATVISRKVSKISGIKLEEKILKKPQHIYRQSHLNRKERQKNIENAYSLHAQADVKDRHILLVDDIYTTGATLNACSRELKRAGAKKITCLTIARAI